jgi:hypothetical protein
MDSKAQSGGATDVTYIARRSVRFDGCGMGSETEAERHLARARRILAQPATLDSHEWMLLATLMVDADAALLSNKTDGHAQELALFASVLEELREVTDDFTDTKFLSASRAARRHKPSLFAPRV